MEALFNGNLLCGKTALQNPVSDDTLKRFTHAQSFAKTRSESTARESRGI
jgi:hypothetical protein